MNPAAAVTIDARWLAGGVGTYALNVVRELRRLNSSMQLGVLTTPAAADSFAPLCDELKITTTPIFSAREQVEMARMAAGSLLHCTHYNAPLLRPGPLIVTIPDVTPLIERDYHSSYKSRMFFSLALRAIARRANHIITVSEYSRAQIVERLRVPSCKISVAYNGVRDVFRPMDPLSARAICSEPLGIRDPFLLYVGNLRAHKNVNALLRAYKLCRQMYRTEHHVVLIATGTQQETQSFRHRVLELGISDFVHRVDFVDETTLVAAYNAADVVVVPSLEEGFGLPVLEAMACGTPVACSDASALPEIAGDAAAYFDPRDSANMADIVQTVVESTALRHHMRTRGLAHAARFTWADSARVHLGIYSRFVGLCPTPQPCNQTAHCGSERVPLAQVAPTIRV